jgi:hypothetical protein
MVNRRVKKRDTHFLYNSRKIFETVTDYVVVYNNLSNYANRIVNQY